MHHGERGGDGSCGRARNHPRSAAVGGMDLGACPGGGACRGGSVGLGPRCRCRFVAGGEGRRGLGRRGGRPGRMEVEADEGGGGHGSIWGGGIDSYGFWGVR